MTVLELDLADGVYDGEAIWEGMIRNPLTSLTAAAIPVKPPSAWFTNPGFANLEPLTVTADGQITGHIASWREDHIGMNGRVKAPRSKSGYAFFATGVLETLEGTQVNVGQITLTGGHASLEASVAEAVAHYDNTNSAFADVAVGEDKHGIWVAGALRPTVDDGQLRAIRASSVSGDWRPINGSLEMVAVCAVNVPGFPIPRARVASGVPVALVAAGTGELVDLMLHQDTSAIEVVQASFDDRLRFIENVMLGRVGDSRETMTAAVEAAREAYTAADDDTEARLAALRASVHPERAVTAAALRARVHPPVTAAALRARVHPETITAAAALRERVHGGGGPAPFVDGSSPLVAAQSFAGDLHPRGKDGKFIEKFGIVELFDVKGVKPGTRGKVAGITPDKRQPGNPRIDVRLDNGNTIQVRPSSIKQAPEKGRLTSFEEDSNIRNAGVSGQDFAPRQPRGESTSDSSGGSQGGPTAGRTTPDGRSEADLDDLDLQYAEASERVFGSFDPERGVHAEIMEDTRFSDKPVADLYRLPREVNGRTWLTFPATGSIDLRFSQNPDGTWQAGFLDLYSGELHDEFAVSEMTNGTEVNQQLGRMFKPAPKKRATSVASAAPEVWDDGMPIDLDCIECLQASLRARVNGGVTATATKAWTADKRDKAASRGAAMPGGRFPIKDCTDVGKAIRALGRGKGDKAAIKRHIVKRAKTLGCMSNIPEDWK